MRKIKIEEIKEKGKAWAEKNQFLLGYACAVGLIGNINIDDFKDMIKSTIEHAQAEGIDLS